VTCHIAGKPCIAGSNGEPCLNGGTPAGFGTDCWCECIVTSETQFSGPNCNVVVTESPASGPFDQPAIANRSDTCRFAKDGICDEPGFGSGSGGGGSCKLGTDCSDCSNCGEVLSTNAPLASGSGAEFGLNGDNSTQSKVEVTLPSATNQSTTMESKVTKESKVTINTRITRSTIPSLGLITDTKNFITSTESNSAAMSHTTAPVRNATSTISKDSGSELALWAIIVILVGVLALFIFVAVAIALVVRRRRRAGGQATDNHLSEVRTRIEAYTTIANTASNHSPSPLLIENTSLELPVWTEPDDNTDPDIDATASSDRRSTMWVVPNLSFDSDLCASSGSVQQQMKWDRSDSSLSATENSAHWDPDQGYEYAGYTTNSMPSSSSQPVYTNAGAGSIKVNRGGMTEA